MNEETFGRTDGRTKGRMNELMNSWMKAHGVGHQLGRRRRHCPSQGTLMNIDFANETASAYSTPIASPFHGCLSPLLVSGVPKRRRRFHQLAESSIAMGYWQAVAKMEEFARNSRDGALDRGRSGRFRESL